MVESSNNNDASLLFFQGKVEGLEPLLLYIGLVIVWERNNELELECYCRTNQSLSLSMKGYERIWLGVVKTKGQPQVNKMKTIDEKTISNWK